MFVWRAPISLQRNSHQHNTKILVIPYVPLFSGFILEILKVTNLHLVVLIRLGPSKFDPVTDYQI
jgi:hypothetical protein